jgi:hypothetical protein
VVRGWIFEWSRVDTRQEEIVWMREDIVRSIVEVFKQGIEPVYFMHSIALGA